MSRACFFLLAWLLAGSNAPARNRPATEEQAQREAAIAEFTARTKAANYPALFDKAAEEFNVPADVLKGVAFAETRWQHLTWPEGEQASPETGMPRPYGIMSLWDNQYFGHSLLEAAALIKQEPETLKKDPYQNIRGAAALLRKLYDENAKPSDAQNGEIEGWRYAIRKYCGIPEPELNAQHALDIYEFMSRGYNDFGIEWKGREVNLEPIRAETRSIIEEARAKQTTGGIQFSNTAAEPAALTQARPLPAPDPSAPGSSAPAGQITAKRFPLWPWLLAACVIILLWLALRVARKQP